MDQIEQLKALRDEAIARIEAAKRAIEEGADGKMVASLDVIIDELEMSKTAHAAKQLVSESAPSSYQDIPWSGEASGEETDQVADGPVEEPAQNDAGLEVLHDESVMPEEVEAVEEVIHRMEGEAVSVVEEEVAIDDLYPDEDQSVSVENERVPVPDDDFTETAEHSLSVEESDHWAEDSVDSDDVPIYPESSEVDPIGTAGEIPSMDDESAEVVEYLVADEGEAETGEEVAFESEDLNPIESDVIPDEETVAVDHGNEVQSEEIAFEGEGMNEPVLEEREFAPGDPVPLVEEFVEDDGAPIDCDQFALEGPLPEEPSDSVPATDLQDEGGVDAGESEIIYHEEAESSEELAGEPPESVDSFGESETEHLIEESEVIDEVTKSSEHPLESELPENGNDAGEPGTVEYAEAGSVHATVTGVNASDMPHPLESSVEDPTRLVGVVPLGSIQGHAPPEPVEVSPGELVGEDVQVEAPVVDSSPESGGQ